MILIYMIFKSYLIYSLIVIILTILQLVVSFYDLKVNLKAIYDELHFQNEILAIRCN